MAMGTCWETNTWDDNAWEADSWESVVAVTYAAAVLTILAYALAHLKVEASNAGA